VRNEIGDKREFVSLNHGSVRFVSEPTVLRSLPAGAFYLFHVRWSGPLGLD
jgi:hypothetical protein